MDALPQDLPAQVAQQTQCAPDLAPAKAQEVLEQARRAFQNTTFTEAWPSCLPGMVALRMSNGSVAYMDKSARYLMLGLVLDSVTGKALDRQLDGRTE